MEEREPLFTLGENVNWYSHNGKQYERFLKKQNKIKIVLPYNPAIPHLCIHPTEMKSRSQRGICTLVLIAALFTIAKIWKKPTFLSKGKRIKKMK